MYKLVNEEFEKELSYDTEDPNEDTAKLSLEEILNWPVATPYPRRDIANDKTTEKPDFVPNIPARKAS